LNSKQPIRDTEEIRVNDSGGKGSAISYAYHLIDPIALAGLAEVMAHGAEKYAPGNWRKVKPEEHLNHLMHHLMLYEVSNHPMAKEEHLKGVLARAMMLYTTVISPAYEWEGTDWDRQTEKENTNEQSDDSDNI
jgi:hypothetical protein